MFEPATARPLEYPHGREARGQAAGSTLFDFDPPLGGSCSIAAGSLEASSGRATYPGSLTVSAKVITS
jgi:hypothetical protein